MNSIDHTQFYNLLVPRLFEVATYQTMMCGKIHNLGKSAQNDVSQTDIHGALTYLDQFTQDYLLVPIYQKWPHLVPLVEEDTGFKRHYLDNNGDDSLILDPIDGTAFYIRGEADYSIMLGLMHQGEMVLALVCYPEQALIYAAMKGQGAWVHQQDGRKTPLAPINAHNANNTHADKSLACHYRLLQSPYQALSDQLLQAGYHLVSNDAGFGTNASGILRIAKGESRAFIGPHISLHDFAVPAFIIQELGGSLKLYRYSGSKDTHSWSQELNGYGQPSPKGNNPRYRMIVGDSKHSIDRIASLLAATHPKPPMAP